MDFSYDRMNFHVLVDLMEIGIITDCAIWLSSWTLVSKIAMPFSLLNLQTLMSESFARLFKV